MVSLIRPMSSTLLPARAWFLSFVTSPISWLETFPAVCRCFWYDSHPHPRPPIQHAIPVNLFLHIIRDAPSHTPFSTSYDSTLKASMLKSHTAGTILGLGALASRQQLRSWPREYRLWCAVRPTHQQPPQQNHLRPQPVSFAFQSCLFTH